MAECEREVDGLLVEGREIVDALVDEGCLVGVERALDLLDGVEQVREEAHEMVLLLEQRCCEGGANAREVRYRFAELALAGEIALLTLSLLRVV